MPAIEPWCCHLIIPSNINVMLTALSALLQHGSSGPLPTPGLLDHFNLPFHSTEPPHSADCSLRGDFRGAAAPTFGCCPGRAGPDTLHSACPGGHLSPLQQVRPPDRREDSLSPGGMGHSEKGWC